ncbi:nitrogen regulation protein [bacterium BMS3Abin05]|nr:nitrogen regulation protein [bacterium BMS3Abin05]
MKKTTQNISPDSPPPVSTILIVDDDPYIRESLEDILNIGGYRCLKAKNGLEAVEQIKINSFDIILLDLKLPRLDGIEVLKKSISLHPDVPVIMISGQGTIQLAVEATKLGAFDFLEKPLEADRTLITVRNALQKRYLQLQRDALLSETQQRYRMIGNDPKMREVYVLIDRASKVSSKVLITGEPGTGKELVARAIPLNGPRAGFPFIPVNCAAIPENLIESELFGYMKGAFTGAMANKIGRFQQAHRGTLFLDEIGDMSLMTQSKILRAIEDNVVEPVGGQKSVQVDVRIIAATNKDLQEEVEKGNFREDLFYRLNVITIHLPPLRQRRMDIRPLAKAFLEEVCSAEGLPQKCVAQNVWPILLEYDWPGNVRELRNVLEQAVILTPDDLIEPPVILQAIQSKSGQKVGLQTEQTLQEARMRFEREFIINTLAAHNSKIQETANALGIQRSHLWKKMKQYGIE